MCRRHVRELEISPLETTPFSVVHVHVLCSRNVQLNLANISVYQAFMFLSPKPRSWVHCFHTEGCLLKCHHIHCLLLIGCNRLIPPRYGRYLIISLTLASVHLMGFWNERETHWEYIFTQIKKTLDTISKCHRPVFSFGVSQHMHNITNLWKFELNRSSKLRDNNERINTLVARSCVLSDAWFRDLKF